MALDVQQSLLNIAQEQGQMTNTESTDFLSKLEQDGRLLKDVW
jgi:sulfite reductase alpha subunit-like flavoprotein